MTLKEAKQVLFDNIEEVNRLQSLSESLLTLSENKITTALGVFTKLHPKEFLTKALNQVKYSAEKKKIKIHTTSIPEAEIKGNEEKLLELFTILFDNAIKYSANETVISLSGAKVKRGLELRVSDKGIGIEEKDIPHVFDRFYRSDSARSRSGVGGYGLGLSIAKKIVEYHKGEISIESTVDIGTTVIVCFPLI
jgi:signal transduction histidine kinase